MHWLRWLCGCVVLLGSCDLLWGEFYLKNPNPESGTTLNLLAGGFGGPGSVDGTGAAARFNYPQGVAADGAGNLFIADTDNDTIRKLVVATGAVTTLAGAAGLAGSTDGTGAAARFDNPQGLALDGAGNLNGDSGYTYIRWSTATCRNWSHEYPIRSAGRHAFSARSAA